MRGQLIFNPMAGRFPSQPLVERAAKILNTNGWDIELVKTQGGDHITKLAKRAARENLDAVFIAGGDGSLHKAVEGLLDSETSLAVLPSGTANVWAQELGLPTLSWTNWVALEQSVKKILNGHVHVMDVGICQGIPFLLWGGAGFDAFVVHHLEPRKRWQKQFPATQYAANVAWFSRTFSETERKAGFTRYNTIRIPDSGASLASGFVLAVRRDRNNISVLTSLENGDKVSLYGHVVQSDDKTRIFAVERIQFR